MRKRQFGKGRLIYASEHNTAQNYMELNVKELAADAGIEGIISGGNLTPHTDPYTITLDSLVARNSAGERIVILAAINFTILPTVNPGVGNEMWVTAYATYAYARSEYDTDVDGNPYYKNYLNSYTISTTQGQAAPTGTAIRPTIPSESVLLCDILYNSTLYASGDIQASDIDISRRLEGGLDEYVRKDGDTMTGALTVQDSVTATSIVIPWATATSYAIGNIIAYQSYLYQCTTAHTSTTFLADLAYWNSISGGASGDYDEFVVTSTGETDFSLSWTPTAQTAVQVTVCGVLQHQSSYSIAGNVLTFTEGLLVNNTVQALRIG